MTEAQHKAVDREIARNNHMKNAGRTSVLRMLGRMIMSKRSLYGAKLADLHSSFTAIDVDNSGTLDRAELDKAFTRLGLGLSEKQKTEAAELLSCDHKDGLITWDSYSKIMNEAKRAYAEEMKAHRTLMSTGILKPKKRYLQMPRSGEKGEQEWDIHFASVHESGSWDVDPDLRLESHQRTNPFNDRDKERKNLNQVSEKVNEKSILNENSSIEERSLERSSEALVTNGGSTLSNTEVPPTRRLGLTHQDEWSCIFHEDELQQSGLTTAPGSANWSPGSNTLRCHISENMKIVAYPGSAIRDGIVTDGSLVYEMRHGRGRGEGATYDDAKTRLLDWNDRTSMVASKFNPGRHTAFRDYFDRPVLLDTNGNLQLHHRHLPSRDEHVKSPVQRNRILHHLEVGEIPHMSTHDILQQFRGLRVASNGQSGLYEVRVPNTMPLLKRYTIHTVHETDYAQERK